MRPSLALAPAVFSVTLLGCGSSGSSSTAHDASTDVHTTTDGRVGSDARRGDSGGDARVQHSDSGSDAGLDARVGADTGADAVSHSDGSSDGGSSCPVTGSGKTTYSCPAGGVEVAASDDLGTAVSALAEGGTLCIHGPHRITAPLVPKKNQTWIGVDATAAIDGSALLDTWAPATGLSGVWVYSSMPLAGQMNQDPVLSGTGASTVYDCYLVSTYQDDVFYNQKRVMRVLSTSQLTGSALPPGQATTSAESSRFFFDYANKMIYLAEDPTGATVELATVATLIDGAGVSGVTLENLLVEKALGNAIITSQSWIITDVTVTYAHEVGIQAGGGTQAAPTTLTRVLMTNNGRYGVSGDGSWLTIADSELSWNNIANHVRVNAQDGGACDSWQTAGGAVPAGVPGGYWGAGGAKIVLASGGSVANPDLQVLNLQTHDNVGPGFWTDVNNRYVLVKGGRFYRNESDGYDHEIGCDIEITGAELDHNGTSIKNPTTSGYGIQISDSNNANVHDNVIHDNAAGTIGLIWQQAHTGILGMAGCISPAPANDSDTSHVLYNDTFTSNRVYSCATGARTGMQYGQTELIASRNNTFVTNAYHMPDTTSTWWDDPNGKTWAEWQAIGLDTAGTAVAPCTYSAAPSCGN